MITGKSMSERETERVRKEIVLLLILCDTPVQLSKQPSAKYPYLPRCGLAQLFKSVKGMENFPITYRQRLHEIFIFDKK